MRPSGLSQASRLQRLFQLRNPGCRIDRPIEQRVLILRDRRRHLRDLRLHRGLIEGKAQRGRNRR